MERSEVSVFAKAVFCLTPDSGPNPQQELTIHRTGLDHLPMITQIHLSLQDLGPPNSRNPYFPKLRGKVKPRNETVDEGLICRGDVINPC